MDFASSQSVADQLLDDFRHESQLINLIIQGMKRLSPAAQERGAAAAQAIE